MSLTLLAKIGKLKYSYPIRKTSEVFEKGDTLHIRGIGRLKVTHVSQSVVEAIIKSPSVYWSEYENARKALRERKQKKRERVGRMEYREALMIKRRQMIERYGLDE